MSITFVIWLMALKYSENTAKVSNLIFLSPFIALIFISITVGETIRIATLIGLVLISYYSATEDLRIVPAMQKAFRHIYDNCKPLPDEQGRLPLAWRGGSYGWPSAAHIIYPVLWVYSKTGDQTLLSLAKMVYDAGQNIVPDRLSIFKSKASY